VAKLVPEQEWQEIGKEKIFQCPCCSKVFKTETRLNSHITQMKKNDLDHRNFFESIMDLIDFDESDNNLEEFRVNTKISDSQGFGSVSIRDSKKKK